MNFEEISREYPIHDTLIGNYSSDQSFTASKLEQVQDIKTWRNNPFYTDSSWMPFIRYENGKFECWGFGFERVQGYFTSNVEGEDYKLVTFLEGFGYDFIDPENPFLNEDYEIMLPDDYDCKKYDYNWNEMVSFKAMNEHIARVFDKKAYEEGRIFTTPEQLIAFIKKMEENT